MELAKVYQNADFGYSLGHSSLICCSNPWLFFGQNQINTWSVGRSFGRSFALKRKNCLEFLNLQYPDVVPISSFHVPMPVFAIQLQRNANF